MHCFPTCIGIQGDKLTTIYYPKLYSYQFAPFEEQFSLYFLCCSTILWQLIGWASCLLICGWWCLPSSPCLQVLVEGRILRKYWIMVLTLPAGRWHFQPRFAGTVKHRYKCIDIIIYNIHIKWNILIHSLATLIVWLNCCKQHGPFINYLYQHTIYDSEIIVLTWH